MRLKILYCEVFHREICHLMSVGRHTCDAESLPKGLHDLGAEKMAPRLQERIDAVEAARYEAVLLVYGLCNNGVAGLRAGHTPLVIPKAHDCITLFLGDRERYENAFHRHPGTYYRTTGWLERGDASGAGDETVSQKLGLAIQYDELVRQYGEDNARYVMETMGDLTANYDRLAYIRMGLAGEEAFRDMARAEAEDRGWSFEEMEGDMGLLRKLVNGDWDDDFVIVQPGQVLRATHDGEILAAEGRPSVSLVSLDP